MRFQLFFGRRRKAALPLFGGEKSGLEKVIGVLLVAEDWANMPLEKVMSYVARYDFAVFFERVRIFHAQFCGYFEGHVDELSELIVVSWAALVVSER